MILVREKIKKRILRLIESFLSVLDAQPFVAPALIAVIFIGLAVFFVATGITPNHDAIEWAGASHFFYTSVGQGVIPYWNPYSQCGTPFFVNFQGFGLLEPSQFVFVLLQKITGCTSLTTYLLHFLFYFFIFIIGTFYVLKLTTEDNKISLLFSLVFLLACFPVVMRQNGPVHYFFLVPFISFFLLQFFKEMRPHRKGFYLFLIAVLCACSFHIYMAGGLIYYVLVFVIASFLLKIADPLGVGRFAVSRHGIFWVALSLGAFALIIAPVYALWHEFQFDNEFVPTMRILQRNGSHLVRTFISDMTNCLFDESFSNGVKTSLSVGNVLLMFSEPSNINYGFQSASEVKLYLSVLPLLCIGLALWKRRDRHSLLFMALAFFMLLIACNFKRDVVGNVSWMQMMIVTIFPLLKMTSVLQNFGLLFLFGLLIVSATGYRVWLGSVRPGMIARLSVAVVVAKWVMLSRTIINNLIFNHNFIVAKWVTFSRTIIHNLIINHDFIVTKWVMFSRTIIHDFNINRLIWSTVLTSQTKEELLDFFSSNLSLAVAVLSGIWVFNLLKKTSMSRLLALAILALFVDMLIFNGMYIFFRKEVLYNKYAHVLGVEQVFTSKQNEDFIDYRDAFSVPEEYFNSFFGHELYCRRKIAFPIFIRNALVAYRKENHLEPLRNFFENAPMGDHFYMTKYYYDLLANVGLDKQVAISGVIMPIVNYFAGDKVVFASDKYEVVEDINRTSVPDCGKKIYIEKADRIREAHSDIAIFFKKELLLNYSSEEMSAFDKALDRKSVPPNLSDIRIKSFNINSLIAIIDAPEDGYFYYGDGYSKHWKAYVDSKPVKIEKTNVNFKSVFVPAGRHEVRFQYDPVRFRHSLYLYFVGLAMSLLTIGIYGAGMVFKKRRRLPVSKPSHL